MILRELTDESKWNNFITNLPRASFLQSWQWGQFQQLLGEKVYFLGFFDGEKQRGAALVILVKARRGYHFLVPHGPLFATEAETLAALPVLIEHLRKLAEGEKATALRLAPLLFATPANQQALRRLGFRSAPLHVHAELTWELDLTPPLDQLQQGMRKTTRHAITKAVKAGVTTEIITGSAGADRFMPLYQQTQERHRFVPFSREFITTQLTIFGDSHSIFTVVASHGGQDLAAAVVIVFGNTAYYYHGASVSNPPVPAAHAVQWAAMQEAKNRGATKYNFWGIAPDDQPQHPFAGITIFKKGFGGYPLDYIHAHDLPLSAGYWKLWLVDTWRKHRRGF